MSVLRFDDYKVEEMNYQRNNLYKPTKKTVLLDPRLSKNINIEGNKINVTLKVSVGSIEDSAIPFLVKCSITGTFTYNSDEDDTEVGIDTLVRNNAVAILYPYIRAIIATLTTTSNEFPGYNLPTINVSKVLAQQNDK